MKSNNSDSNINSTPKSSVTSSKQQSELESSSLAEIKTRFESYSTKALISYYAQKIADYENEVEKQKQLLKKRKQLLSDTKKLKFKLVDLKIQHDAIVEETTKIDNEISHYME